MELQAWKIYLWEEGPVWFGVAPIMTNDGIKELYYETCEYNSGDSKQRFNAKNQVKKQLLNLMNAINWYGKGVLNKDGNIDPIKFREQEAHTALVASRLFVEVEQIKPFKKFEVKVINPKQARDYRFI